MSEAKYTPTIIMIHSNYSNYNPPLPPLKKGGDNLVSAGFQVRCTADFKPDGNE